MVFVGEAGLFLKKVEFFDVACPHDSNLIIEKPANQKHKRKFLKSVRLLLRIYRFIVDVGIIDHDFEMIYCSIDECSHELNYIFSFIL